MARGFLYLVLVMDWYRRYVLAWRLSNTMDASFCLDALEDASRKAQPRIFNTDQGAQFPRAAFTDKLEAAGIRALVRQRPRRAVAQLEVRSGSSESLCQQSAACIGIGHWFRFYNEKRPAPGLGLQTVGHGLAEEALRICRSAWTTRLGAHNFIGPTTAKRRIDLTRNGSGLTLRPPSDGPAAPVQRHAIPARCARA